MGYAQSVSVCSGWRKMYISRKLSNAYSRVGQSQTIASGVFSRLPVGVKSIVHFCVLEIRTMRINGCFRLRVYIGHKAATGQQMFLGLKVLYAISNAQQENTTEVKSLKCRKHTMDAPHAPARTRYWRPLSRLCLWKHRITGLKPNCPSAGSGCREYAAACAPTDHAA
jgi:hypothetical protein